MSTEMGVEMGVGKKSQLIARVVPLNPLFKLLGSLHLKKKKKKNPRSDFPNSFPPACQSRVYVEQMVSMYTPYTHHRAKLMLPSLSS